MDEVFHHSVTLEGERLHALTERKDLPGLIRFGLQFGVFILSAVIAVWQFERQNWWWCALALCGVALLVPSMFAAAHETVHRTAFKSRRINDVVCWLAGLGFVYMPEFNRQFHFAHHRHTRDPKLDPELARLGRPGASVTSGLPVYLAFVSGVPLFAMKTAFIGLLVLPLPLAAKEKLFPYIKPASFPKVQYQARVFALCYAALGVAGCLWWPGIFSLLVGLLAGHGLLCVYLVAEHGGLPHEGSILERTRTTHTNAFVRFMMWNMPYHAEHHAYPAVPWHALPQLHQLMEEDLVHTSAGYPRLHRRVLSRLARGEAFHEDGP